MNRLGQATFAALIAANLMLVPASPAQATPTSARQLDSSAPTQPDRVLYAGQKLVEGSGQNMLQNGDFTLTVQHGMVDLEQLLTIPGPAGPMWFTQGSWFRDDGHSGHDLPGTTLTMRRNGNLVLETATGVVLWASKTAGTGTNNRLVLNPNGNLVIYTSNNRRVWSSHSGRVSLPAGGVLASGHRLIDAWDSHDRGFHPQTLTMQRDGNLVRRCGSYVLWQSHTHVRGSELQLRMDGNLVIVTPTGRVVWSAHTGGHDYTYLNMDEPSVKVVAKFLWEAKYPYHAC